MATYSYIGYFGLKPLCVVAEPRGYVFNLYRCPITDDVGKLNYRCPITDDVGKLNMSSKK